MWGAHRLRETSIFLLRATALRREPLVTNFRSSLFASVLASPCASEGVRHFTHVARSTPLHGLCVARDAWPHSFTPGGAGGAGGAVRWKQTKRQSYRKAPRAAPCGQGMPNKPHIGVKALSCEYVETGRVICKQRKYIAKNPLVTRHRHFKLYPGVNVKVLKNTSLAASCSGRVKMTHDVKRDVMIMNVLAEPREELLRDETWRYRTEHVESYEENRYLCYLRSKALPIFGKDSGWVNPPEGPKPMKVRISAKKDEWNNPLVRDMMDIEPFAYPMTRHTLARHIKKVRARQQGVPDEDNDPDLHVSDPRYHLFKGQTAQR